MALIAMDPEKFFRPAYVAQHGYVGVYLDTGAVDWDEVSELIDAYRLAAPKKLAGFILSDPRDAADRGQPPRLLHAPNGKTALRRPGRPEGRTRSAGPRA
jgi:hypothetical protein